MKSINPTAGLFIAALFSCVTVFAQQSDAYQYRIDLTEVRDDQVQVELIAPKFDKGKAVFQMPKIVPGTYSISDFGRFVTDLKAFDRQGGELVVKRLETNAWEIAPADQLYRLTYRVHDTYDAAGDNPVSGMGGTNIEAGQNFVLNNFGFFGYFAGRKFQPFQVTVKKPEGFYGSSAFENVVRTEEVDVYTAPDYHYLVDMPIMYNRPDTTTIQLGQTEVLISVYSPHNNVRSAFLAEQFRELLYSQKAYLKGRLPVSRYAFILYFGDPGMTAPTGALEHNYSSFYCLPDYPQAFMASMLVDIAAHEFFHILTPLNIHSEQIHFFDFNEPDMSEHLWLYEGVTEYFSHHNQVRSGLITPEEFLNRMAEKIQNSRRLYDDDLPFTELSRKCLDKYEGEYGNVYEKGALIAMCLDLELLRLSNGEQGLIELIQDLAQTYGAQKPFQDKRLFKEIEKRSHPEIRQFFKKYVDGDTPLPYDRYFRLAGVNYQRAKDTLVYSLGGVQLGYNRETGRVVVAGTYQMDWIGRALGYQAGDELLAVNGEEIPADVARINSFFERAEAGLREGQLLRVDVLRKDESGQQREARLEATVRKVAVSLPPAIHLREDATAEQRRLQEVWLGR